MTDKQTFTPDWFSKPGDSLRALMIRRGITAQDLAGRFAGGIATIKGLLDGTCAISRDHATALEASLGGSASYWLRRQSNYDADLERALDRISSPDADAWLQLQVPGERPRGRLSEERRRAELRRRLVFYNVGTIKSWEARYGRICDETLFRTSEVFASDDAAMLMWLRSGELGADMVSTRTWSAGNLEDRLKEIRALSKVRRPEYFLPKLKTLCAEAGVAVVVKRAPNGCRASGASRMVAPDKAMILLSFRGLSDDKFWFTVFHEIGHLVLHGAKTFVDADMEELNESEREANEFASRTIIPEKRSSEFERLEVEKDSVIRFSVSVGVSPGLTVGQMQHRQMIEPHQMNYLKRHWRWADLAAVMD